VGEHAVVELYKLPEELPTGIQLDRQAAFGEVDLYDLGAVVKATANVGNRLDNTMVEKLLPGVAGDSILRIQDGRRIGRYYRLFEWPGRKAPGPGR
jgi:hypothetical protein